MLHRHCIKGASHSRGFFGPFLLLHLSNSFLRILAVANKTIFYNNPVLMVIANFLTRAFNVLHTTPSARWQLPVLLPISLFRPCCFSTFSPSFRALCDPSYYHHYYYRYYHYYCYFKLNFFNLSVQVTLLTNRASPSTRSLLVTKRLAVSGWVVTNCIFDTYTFLFLTTKWWKNWHNSREKAEGNKQW